MQMIFSQVRCFVFLLNLDVLKRRLVRLFLMFYNMFSTGHATHMLLFSALVIQVLKIRAAENDIRYRHNKCCFDGEMT